MHELLQEEVHVVDARERVVGVVEPPEVGRPVGDALEPQPLDEHRVGVLAIVDQLGPGLDVPAVGVPASRLAELAEARPHHDAPARVVAADGYADPVLRVGAHGRVAAGPVLCRERMRLLVYLDLAGEHHLVLDAAQDEEELGHPPGRGGTAPPVLPGHRLEALEPERLDHELHPVGDGKLVVLEYGAGGRRERLAAPAAHVSPDATGLVAPAEHVDAFAPRAAVAFVAVEERRVAGLGEGPVSELVHAPVAIPDDDLRRRQVGVLDAVPGRRGRRRNVPSLAAHGW